MDQMLEQIRNIAINYNIEMLIALTVAFLVLLILYIISQFRISHITEKYNKLVRGVDGINLEEVVLQSLDDLDYVRMDVEKLENHINKLEERLKFAIQKVGLIRYDAFADMGSELSFSIAFLDDNLNGFVFTSIYGREFSTTYIKSIEKGKSEYPLSAEEMQAIDRAIKII